MVLPQPVWPTRAIVRPAGTSRSMFSSTGRSTYENDTFSKRTSPRTLGRGVASGRSTISIGASRISYTRAPEAMARCARPVSQPITWAG